MALIVQSNPPVDGANGYVSVAEFKSYCDARLKVYAPKTDQEIEAAIVVASMFADMRFTYKGYRVEEGQLTEFPRTALYDDRDDLVEGIPALFKQGVIEYAFRALRTDLWADPTRDASGAFVTERSEKVGPVEESVKFDPSTVGQMPSYPYADRLISARGITVSSQSGGGISVGEVGRA
jgi:hypothetical protein